MKNLLILLASIFLIGCQSSNVKKESYTLAPKAIEIVNKLELHADKYRVIVYRPNTFLGAMAKPKIVIDSQHILPRKASSLLSLRPGQAIVIDLPRREYFLWLSQNHRSDAERKVQTDFEGKGIQYFKISPKPTYTYLKPVDVLQAGKDLSDIDLIGQVILAGNSQRACSFSLNNSPKYVAIESIHDAHTVFYGLGDREARTLEASLPSQGVSLLSWSEFITTFDNIYKSAIRTEGYPIPEKIAAFKELLKKYPVTPIGLTWNGGIAITRTDYRFAEEGYKNYLDSGKLEMQSQSLDPLHPINHFIPLLCW